MDMPSRRASLRDTCFKEVSLPIMGVGRIFSRWATRGFFKNFSRGAKSGEIRFFPLKTKKTTFFAKDFKIQGGLDPPVPLPTLMVPVSAASTIRLESHSAGVKRLPLSHRKVVVEQGWSNLLTEENRIQCDLRDRQQPMLLYCCPQSETWCLIKCVGYSRAGFNWSSVRMRPAGRSLATPVLEDVTLSLRSFLLYMHCHEHYAP